MSNSARELPDCLNFLALPERRFSRLPARHLGAKLLECAFHVARALLDLFLERLFHPAKLVLRAFEA
jgi:hypothetical protein